MASTFALSPLQRRPLTQRRGSRARFYFAAALFIAVLVAEAVVILLNAANIPDITSLYIFTT